MISIIICSRKPDIPQELKDNIAETIGVEYELIIIDNSRNGYSIFSAYNEGVRRSKYSYLCFMHEDILYHSNGWGKLVIEHLQNPEIGIISVAGGHFLPNTPASWPSTQLKSQNILQSSSNNGIKQSKHVKELDYIIGDTAEVVAIDGVWFCMPKHLFNIISFDEENFSGYHFYDLDIALQVKNALYKNIVISDILIEHFSGGNWNNEWIKNAIIFHNKWKEQLPLISGVTLNEKEQELRTLFAENTFSLLQNINNLQYELNKTRNSKAYRLGKLILKPFSFIRHRIL